MYYFTYDYSDVIIFIIIALVVVVIVRFIFKFIHYVRIKELAENTEIIVNKLMDMQTNTQIQLNKLNARTELTNTYLKQLIDKDLTENKLEVKENEEKKVLQDKS